MYVYVYIHTHTLSLSHIWLCDPMDCSAPGSSVHGIFQGRILEWVAVSFSRASSPPRDWTWVSCIEGRFFNNWATREVAKLCSMGTILSLICFLESVPHCSCARSPRVLWTNETCSLDKLLTDHIYIYINSLSIYIYILFFLVVPVFPLFVSLPPETVHFQHYFIIKYYSSNYLLVCLSSLLGSELIKAVHIHVLLILVTLC